MAVLTSAIRNTMPKKEFAGPGETFPVNDKEHAQLALDFVGRSEAAGHISSQEAASIRHLANAKLGK